MKITVVCDVSGAENDGIKDSEKYLIDALRERGHEVVAVAGGEEIKDGDGCMTVAYQDGEPLSRADRKRLELLVWDSDIVWLLYPSDLGRVALICCNRHNIPAVMDFPQEHHSQYRWLYVRFCRRADAVRYSSEDIRSRFEGRFGHAWKSFVIPFDADKETLDRLEDMFYSIR